MSKKVIISILLGASLSFATWGYFPLKESNSGFEVKATHLIAFGDYDARAFNLNARYVLGSTIEFALMNVGYPIFQPSISYDNPIFSTRLQLFEKTSVFAEIALPTPNGYGVGEYIYLGVQQAIVLNKFFAWSTEFGYCNRFDDNGGYSPASTIKAATEFDMSISPSFIWFVGTRFEMSITEGEYNGDVEQEVFDSSLDIFGGISLKVYNNTYIEEEVGFHLLDDDYFEFILSTSLKYSF